MIPCIENKCLMFPSCKNKKYIDCPDLTNYYYHLRKTYSCDEAHKYMNSCLTEMCGFSTLIKCQSDWVYED